MTLGDDFFWYILHKGRKKITRDKVINIFASRDEDWRELNWQMVISLKCLMTNHYTIFCI